MKNHGTGFLKRLRLAAVCCAISIAFVSHAEAAGVPDTVVDPALNPLAVDGHLQVVFTYSDARNEDLILSIPALAANPILDNHTTPIGSVIDLGSYTGNLTFKLDNIFTGATYYSDQLDGYGDYHVRLDANYADFGVGSLDPTSLANITTLANAGYSLIFMAWEDHDLGSYETSDWDYNDVIFALAYQVHLDRVPEPLSLSMFGVGLAGVAGLRRRKKATG